MSVGPFSHEFPFAGGQSLPHDSVTFKRELQVEASFNRTESSTLELINIAKKVIKDVFVRKTNFPRFSHRPPKFSLINEQQILELCKAAGKIFEAESNMVEVRTPCRVFGDIHGQFNDLLKAFKL